MLDWCVGASGSVCFFSFFVSVLASAAILFLAIFQYWAEKRTENVLANLPYYMRRANLIAPFGLIGFAIKIIAINPHLYNFGDFLLNSNTVVLILILGFMCHYCVTAIQEINRLPPSHFILPLVIVNTVFAEVLLIVALILENVYDKSWPALLIYFSQMLSILCIPLVIAYQSGIIFKIVRKNTASLPARAKNNTTTGANQLSRWKALMIFTVVLSVLAVCAECYFTYTAYLRFHVSWEAHRNPANPYTISLQVIGFCVTVWYAWVPFSPKPTDSSNIPTHISQSKPGGELNRSSYYPRITVDSSSPATPSRFKGSNENNSPQNGKTLDAADETVSVLDRSKPQEGDGLGGEGSEETTPRIELCESHKLLQASSRGAHHSDSSSSTQIYAGQEIPPTPSQSSQSELEIILLENNSSHRGARSTGVEETLQDEILGQ